MKNQQLLDNILAIISSVREDNKKLQQINDYLMTEIYEEKEEIIPDTPEKYKPLLKNIAEELDCGMIVYLNLDTNEIQMVPKDLFNGMVDDCDGIWEETVKETESWEHSIRINPPDSRESFKIMEDFIEKEIPDAKLKNRLTNAISQRKPFANFRNIIDNTEYLEDWYYFKNKYLQIYAATMINREL